MGFVYVVDGVGSGGACIRVEGGNAEEVCRAACERLGGGPSGLYLLRGGRILGEEDALADGDFVQVRRRVHGGKGGFGNMLRGQGPAKKTTNFDACRDLSGRRLRSQNAHARVEEWKKKQEHAAAKEHADPGEASSSKRSQESEPQFDAGAFESTLADVGARVGDAVSEGLQVEAKRGDKSAHGGKPQGVAKKRKRIFYDIEDGSGSDSEGEEASSTGGSKTEDAGPKAAEVPPAKASKKGGRTQARLLATEPVSDVG